jgi:Uma2 family endonuclease
VAREHSPRIHRYSYEAYLEHEAASNGKHEYLDGEIYAMAGGTIEHAIIAGNIISSLGAQLAGTNCVVASSDLKVRVPATGLVTYPDVTVICGPIERDSKSRDVVLNPTLVVEVLSDSTEDWDRGEKLDHYKQIASLQTCVLVSHRQRQIVAVSRRPDGSWHTEISAGPAVTLGRPGVALAVDEVYANVEVGR